MNKTELVSALAHKTGKSQKEAKAFLEAFTETVTETLKSGGKVTLIGFGSFDVLEIKARTGRNPRTGEPLQIKGKKKPRFKAGSELTDSVN